MHRLLTLTPLATQETCAITEETPMTVTADWLASHLDHKNLVLLHVGVKNEYDAIPVPEIVTRRSGETRRA